MECVGAIDQGTQSTRFFLYDKDCKPIAKSQVEFPQIYQKAGWCEQDPNAIWNSVVDAIKGALDDAKKQNITPIIKAVGITNQRETTIVWDKTTGQPLYNAIVWLDNRTADVCRTMSESLKDRDYFRNVTGLPISTYFSAYKLKWMLENVPAVSAATEERRCMFGTVDSWLLYKLTGGVEGGIHVTDVSNASRTNLMELSSLTWHKPTVELFGASKVTFPDIKSNAEIYGYIKNIPGLDGVPVSGCLGDQQAALVGQRCAKEEAKNTYGTGCFLLLNTGTTPVHSTHGLLTTMAFKLGPTAPACYALEGSIAIAGQGISWLRDAMGFIQNPADTEDIAGSVDDTAGVYFVPAFGGLLAPWWRDDARGVILGLTQFTTKAHVVRAMLEAICFQTRDVLEAMQKDADLSHLTRLFVDGGASKNNLLMQLQADILQVPVQRPSHMETTSLGAALAAGIGVGFWTQEQAFTDLKQHADGALFEPKIDVESAQKRHDKWKKAVAKSMDLADFTD